MVLITNNTKITSNKNANTNVKLAPNILFLSNSKLPNSNQKVKRFVKKYIKPFEFTKLGDAMSRCEIAFIGTQSFKGNRIHAAPNEADYKSINTAIPSTKVELQLDIILTTKTSRHLKA